MRAFEELRNRAHTQATTTVDPDPSEDVEEATEPEAPIETDD